MELAKEKREHFFVTVILSEGNFFNSPVLFQCIAYWINFQNIYTFIYQKTLLETLLLLLFEIVESFHCILIWLFHNSSETIIHIKDKRKQLHSSKPCFYAFTENNSGKVIALSDKWKLYLNKCPASSVIGKCKCTL